MQVGVPVYAEGTNVKPSKIAKHGLEEARKKSIDVVIVDTAGRLQVSWHLYRWLLFFLLGVSSKSNSISFFIYDKKGTKGSYEYNFGVEKKIGMMKDL